MALESASLIISTVSDIEDNLLLLKAVGGLKKKPKVIMIAMEKHEAKELYDNGADYVIIPHVAGGHHLAELLEKENRSELIEKYKNKEFPSTT